MTGCHFSLAEFAAYRRAELPRRVGTLLEKHLQEGCATCGADLDFVEHLTEVARRDGLATPPAQVLERARGLFRPDEQLLGKWLGGQAHSLVRNARLICDSFQQPVAVGVRGALRLDRRLVFGDQDFLLDLHLEPEQKSERQSITGQVQSTSMTEEQLSGLAVMLVEGQRVLMSTRTNRRGEFVFDAAPRREVSLCVVCRDRLVKVPSLPPAAVE